MRLLLSSKFGKDAVFASTSRSVPHGMSEEQLFYSALICNVHPQARLLELSADLNQARAQPQPQSSIEVRGGGSPYPLLDAFILGHCKRMCPSGGQAFISSWSREGHRIFLRIQGHRYCEHVNREHSRSNVKYVIDIRGGSFYQCCNCQRCQGFKSPSRPLPLDLI